VTQIIVINVFHSIFWLLLHPALPVIKIACILIVIQNIIHIIMLVGLALRIIYLKQHQISQIVKSKFVVNVLLVKMDIFYNKILVFQVVKQVMLEWMDNVLRIIKIVICLKW
jgi:hypothetical protein